MRPRALKVILYSLAGLLILSVLFVEYSMSPQFCNSCHIMEPYYSAWKTSTHNFVPCVDCHYTPGLQSQARSKFEALNQVVSYVTRTYGSRPRAEISDWSCLRSECHSQRPLQGLVDFEGIHFDHEPHLVEVRRGLKLRCTSCHSQIVQGTHMTVTTSTCFLCHFKGVEIGESISGCPSCHPPPQTTIQFEGVVFNHSEVVEREIQCTKCHVQVVQGDGGVPRERCLICHGEPQRIEKYDDVSLIHGRHVSDHKIDCEECHNAIQHGLVKMVSTLEVDCASCHPDHHSEVKELYMGIGGKGVPANPSSMFMTRVGCNGCHLVHKEIDGSGSVMVALEASCLYCHGTEFHGMLENWKSEITASLESLWASLATAEEIVSKQKRSPAYGNAVTALETARHNLGVIQKGSGVHNVGYSIELLKSAFESIQAAMEGVGSSYRPPRPEIISITGPVKESCATCHVGMKAKKVEVFGIVFDHRPHLEEGLDCQRCHEARIGYSEKGHGRLELSVDDCNGCHHQEGPSDCEGCHSGFRTRALPFRDFGFVHQDHLDRMEIACGECHEGAGGKGTAVRADIDCGSCHHRSADLSCERCHTDQERFFRGQGVGGISVDPNVMQGSVSCRDCHQGIEGEHERESIRQACVDCHSEEYGKIMDDWQRETGEAIEEVGKMIRRVKGEGIGREEHVSGGIAGAIQSADEKMSWVKRDGSAGVHHPLLAHELLESSAREIRAFSEMD